MIALTERLTLRKNLAGIKLQSAFIFLIFVFSFAQLPLFFRILFFRIMFSFCSLSFFLL